MGKKDTEKSESTASGFRERRRVKKEKKRERKKSIPLAYRIAIQSVKTIFIRIPSGLLVIIVLSFLFLSIYMTPPVVQEILQARFNAASTGTLDLKVKSFSLFNGFVIEDVVVRSGADFDDLPVAKIKRIVFRYSLGGLLLGHLRFPEIGIYEPSFFLREKNGRWNAATLMKPSETVGETEVETQKEEDQTEISLPVNVDLYLNFILRNCDLKIEASGFDSGFKGLSFAFGLDIPPFKKIPLSVDAVSLLKDMKIELNPGEVFEAYYRSRDLAMGPPLMLTWRLDFTRSGKNDSGFASVLKMGAYGTPVRFVNSHMGPLHSMLTYDIFYDPVSDSLTLRDLSFTFKNSRWISLRGNVYTVTADPRLDIHMAESSINLDEVLPYYRAFTGDRKTRFSGMISLSPLDIRGVLSGLTVKGGARFTNISYRTPGLGVSLPELRCDYICEKKGGDMDVSMGLAADRLSWSTTGSRPGNAGFRFSSRVETRSSMSRFILPLVALKVFNPVSRASAVDMHLKGDISTGKITSGWISIDRLCLEASKLPEMVSSNLRKKVMSIPLKKPVEGNVFVRFRNGESDSELESTVSMAIPDFDIPDFKIDASVRQDRQRQRIDIRKFKAGSESRNIALVIGGYISRQREPISDSDLSVEISMNNPEMKKFSGPWEGSGLFSFNTRLKGDLDTGSLSGSLRMDRFTVKNRETHLAINDMSMDFPYVFDFSAGDPGRSLLGVMQSHVIDSKSFADRPNMKIGSVWMRHPARNIPLMIMKDFSAFIDFRDNVFRLTEMKAYVLDGSLYARRILVNLANLDMKHLSFNDIKDNIEYSLNLDLTNVDIGRLDDPGGKKRKGAELSLNANFSGRGIDVTRELSVEGYINIFKIGEKFANRLMKGLSSEKGSSKLGGVLQSFVDNWTKIQGFQFVLSKGLAYPTVVFESGLMSMIATVDNNRIEFDRIPIQEYLRKVRKGD